MTTGLGALGTGESDLWRPAPLRTDRVALEPVGREHYEFLRRAEVSILGATWRHRGQVRSPEQFTSWLWAGVLCQYLAVRRPKGDPLAWLQCYNADQTAGTAFLAIGRLSGARTLDLLFQQACLLFIDHIYDCWPIRKLVLEVPEFNLPRIESGVGDLFQIEGRLTEMVWAGGRHWDVVMLSLGRDAWERDRRVEYLRTRARRNASRAEA